MHIITHVTNAEGVEISAVFPIITLAPAPVISANIEYIDKRVALSEVYMFLFSIFKIIGEITAAQADKASIENIVTPALVVKISTVQHEAITIYKISMLLF